MTVWRRGDVQTAGLFTTPLERLFWLTILPVIGGAGGRLPQAEGTGAPDRRCIVKSESIARSGRA